MDECNDGGISKYTCFNLLFSNSVENALQSLFFKQPYSQICIYIDKSGGIGTSLLL